MLSMKAFTGLSKPHMIIQMTPPCLCILAAASIRIHCPGQAGQAPQKHHGSHNGMHGMQPWLSDNEQPLAIAVLQSNLRIQQPCNHRMP